MNIPLTLARKLELMAIGEQLPASKLGYPVVREMLAEQIIYERRQGRTKSTFYVQDREVLYAFLQNKYGIAHLPTYIQTLQNPTCTRAEMVLAANDSKVAQVRTFKGFLVNSYMPISAMLNGVPFLVQPPIGSFLFIHNFSSFTLPQDVVVVGVENAENFSHVHLQQHLFGTTKTLFVSRYPQTQSKDLMAWLLSIPNPYLHFGDFDFAGINIYQQEYKTHLNTRAMFFVPPNIESMLQKHGNRALYDKQKLNSQVIDEPQINHLINQLHQYKMGLEQEALLIIGR